MDWTAAIEEIKDLKKKRNAIILAHNYQRDEVQDIADHVGDSLDLSQIAAKSDAAVIVFCGVHFMAESAAILAPEKTVLLPELSAGCPLADMITYEELVSLKQEHPKAAVATYINSSAAVKAESDICVTSANAVNVVNSLDADEVIFIPDGNLASYVAGRVSKKIIPWPGYCITHHRVTADDVKSARSSYPEAVIVVHPECKPEVVALADAARGTSGMIAYSKETVAKEIIIGTEMGMLYRLKQEVPDKQFYLLSSGLICPNMKYTTLPKVLTSLKMMQHQITVPVSIGKKAALSLQRMLAVPSG